EPAEIVADNGARGSRLIQTRIAAHFVERKIEADEIDIRRNARLVEREAQCRTLRLRGEQLPCLVAQHQPVGARSLAPDCLLRIDERILIAFEQIAADEQNHLLALRLALIMRSQRGTGRPLMQGWNVFQVFRKCFRIALLAIDIARYVPELPEIAAAL